MDEHVRHDRTLRLLEARLEALASACERTPRGDHRFDTEIAAAAAATRHAVELGLISAPEANSVWAAVASRHPDAPWRRRALPLAA